MDTSANYIGIAGAILAVANQNLTWVMPADKLPKSVRVIVGLLSAAGIFYAVAVYALIGANMVPITMPRWFFLVVCAAAGLGIGLVAWQHIQPPGSASPPAKSSGSPDRPRTVEQKSQGDHSPNVVTGAHSPGIIGDHNTVVYGSPSSAPSAEEGAYRTKLADELNDSAHDLEKSVNRWYTASLGGDRPVADENWEQAKARMGASHRLLHSKVNKTAAAEFIQNQAGQPVAHMNLRGLRDGAAISDMWHRYTRMTQIERRVRNGVEPIVWPPPSTP